MTDWYVDTDVAGGGDGTIGDPYDSLETALAAKEADITGTESVIFHCDGASADGVASIDTWVTDATHFVTVQVDSGNRSANGVWDASKYNITNATTAQCLHIDGVDFTEVYGLQMEVTGTGTYDFGIRGSNSPTDPVIGYCIARHVESTGAGSNGIQLSASTNANVFNCLVYGWPNTGIFLGGDAASCIMNNCTAYGCGGNAMTTGYGDTVAQNNISYNNTGDDYADEGWAAGSDYNMSEDATAPGANSLDSGTGGNDPDFVNTGSENFNLGSSSDAIGAATVSPGSYSDDLAGTTRGAAWDMGALEFVAAGGGVIMNQLQQSNLGSDLFNGTLL